MGYRLSAISFQLNGQTPSLHVPPSTLPLRIMSPLRGSQLLGQNWWVLSQVGYRWYWESRPLRESVRDKTLAFLSFLVGQRGEWLAVSD